MRLDRVGRLLPLCGALALVSVVDGVAAAEPTTETPPPAGTDVRLELEAPPDCTTRDELVARVVARSSRIRFVAAAGSSTLLRVSVASGARGGFVGQLDVAEPDGRRFARRIEAPSCAEATDALALVIAITFDPAVASGAGDLAGGPSATAGPAAPAPSAPSAPPPRVAQESVESARSPGGARVPPRPPTVRRGTLGIAGEAVSGPAPGPMYGVALTIALTLDRHTVLSPVLSASLAHVGADDFAEPGGIAAFELDAATLDLCPLRLDLAPVAAAACGTGALGRLEASGTYTYSGRSASRPYATVGGAMLLTVALGNRFELRGRFGVGASLVRDSFEFTPTVFHRTASVTLVGDLGLGVRFP